MDEFIEKLITSIFGGFTIGTDSLLIDNTMLNASNIIWDYFELFAIGLTLVYFLVEVNKQWALEGRDMNIKTFFVPFLKLMMAVVVIALSPQIVSAVISFNNTLVTEMKTSLSANIATENSYDFADAIESMGFLEKMIAIIPLLAFWLVSAVISLVFAYKALMYKLELLLRVGFTPIAMADVYSGHNANAMRWIKGLIAIGLYGACFIVIPILGTTLFTSAAGTNNIVTFTDIFDMFEYIITALVIPFAEIGMLGVAKQMTKEVMGV